MNVFVAGDPGRHLMITSCRVAANKCLLDTSNPCSVCEVWSVKTWNKLRKALGDARTRAIQRGNPHWISAFPQILSDQLLQQPVPSLGRNSVL